MKQPTQVEDVQNKTVVTLAMKDNYKDEIGTKGDIGFWRRNRTQADEQIVLVHRTFHHDRSLSIHFRGVGNIKYYA